MSIPLCGGTTVSQWQKTHSKNWGVLQISETHEAEALVENAALKIMLGEFGG